MKPVTFTWNPVTIDMQGSPLSFVPTYKLYAVVSTGNYGAPLATTQETTVTVAMPTTGTYKAVVTASGPDGDSGQSNQITFPSVPQIPVAPSGLVAS